MPELFSQAGEDAVLWSLFDPAASGFYLEIGALDGLRFSNCLSFERAGWRGICVEAHAHYAQLLRKNRPASTVVHAAVSDHDADEVAFYANQRGSLSTLDRSMETVWRQRFSKYFSGFEVQRVAMRTVDSILAEHKPADVPLDVVSIDVEGHELAVLRGFDLERHRPRVLVIEAIDQAAADALKAHMTGRGYRTARRLESNWFFCRDEADVATLAAANADVTTTWLPHPMDAKETGRRRRSRRSAAPPPPRSMVRRLATLVGVAPPPAAPAARVRLTPEQRQARREERKRMPVNVGFHGDRYLLRLVAYLASRVEVFIETGANVGNTTRYVAATYGHLSVYACESDATSFDAASERLAGLPNATLSPTASPQFLHDLVEARPTLTDRPALFWLDAHGYGFRWPLKDEIAFITRRWRRACILIDDFRVPGRPDFAFDQSEDQLCAIETIAPDLDPRHAYRIVYPRYRERTSPHHPLTGTGLIVFGDDAFALPPELTPDFKIAPAP